MRKTYLLIIAFGIFASVFCTSVFCILAYNQLQETTQEKINKNNISYEENKASLKLMPLNNVKPDDVFTKLISNNADLTWGEAEFEITNPLNQIISIDISEISINIITAKGSPINNFEIYKMETWQETETITTQTCTKKNITNTNGTYETENCTENKSDKNITRNEYKEIKNITLNPGEKEQIKIRASYEAIIGQRTIEWIPTIKIGTKNITQNKWAWWNTSWERCVNITITRTVKIPANYTHTMIINTTNVDYSKFAANGADLRILNGTNCTTNGNFMYNYTILNWNTTGNSTIEFMTRNENTSVVLLYYNNTAATDAQNTNTTYLFDQRRGTMNCTKWISATNVDGGVDGVGVCQANGIFIQLNKSLTADSAVSFIPNVTMYPEANTSDPTITKIRSRFYATATNRQIHIKLGTVSSRLNRGLQTSDSYPNQISMINSTGTAVNSTNTWDTNENEVNYTIIINYTTILVNATNATASWQPATYNDNASSNTAGTIRVGGYTQNSRTNHSVYWYNTRKYINETPTYTFGTTESSVSTNCWTCSENKLSIPTGCIFNTSTGNIFKVCI